MSKVNAAERLAKLKERDQNSREMEIRLSSMRDHAESELKKFREQAEADFGTSDLDKLRGIFAKAKEEDDRALNEYEESIELREKLIDATNAKLNSLQSGYN